MPAPDPFPDPDQKTLYLRSEEFGARITEYCAWLNAGDYQLLLLIREFDQQGLWKVNDVCSCAHWLNWQCGIGMNAAREKVRVANASGDLPKVSETYRKGEISYSKVRAITRIATPETEEQRRRVESALPPPSLRGNPPLGVRQRPARRRPGPVGGELSR